LTWEFQLPYSSTICGSEELTSSGPITLGFDNYGEGMLPEADKGNRISEMFTSSVPRCSIKTIILVQNEEGDPIGDDAIVKIKDDFLVTDISKGKSAMTHIYYLQATTIAGI
jgi:hypothetical protein